MCTLTVFTPTFNRADTLSRTFRSLEHQTSKDFVWLVIDDGSTDETRQLVGSWISGAPFRIEYVYQPNAGKHNAHNRAAQLASTPLLVILDADDELLPDAVDIIATEWRRMSAAERDALAGIWTLCQTPDGARCGDPFPAPRLDTSLQVLRYEYGCDGERLPCFRTDVLRAFPFPATPPGACAYIPEAFIWSAITRRYPLRFLDLPCRIYHPGPGLSERARNEYQVSEAIVYAYVQPLANDLPWFWREPRLFLTGAAQTVRYGLHSKSLPRILRALSWPARLMVAAAFPIGLALLVRDYLSGRIAKQVHAPPVSEGDFMRSAAKEMSDSL